MTGKDTGNGMFMGNQAYGVRDMLDGTGQTIPVGECGILLTQVPWAGVINMDESRAGLS